MIKNIMGGKYVNVIDGTPSGPSVYNYNNGVGVGNVRFSPSTQSLEVFDGNTWQMFQMGYARVELSAEAQLAIDWANEQRGRLLRAAELAKKSSTIADALAHVQEAQDKLQVVMTLAE